MTKNSQQPFNGAAKASKRRYHPRVEALLKRMALSPMGAEMVAFVRENDIPIRFEANFGKRGSNAVGDILTEEIFLNPLRSDDKLLSALAHEIRHVWQGQQIKKAGVNAGWFCLSPLAALGHNRFLEADAYAFEDRFLQEYARHTGDEKPWIAHGKRDVPAWVTGAGGGYSFRMEELISSGGYDKSRLLSYIRYMVARGLGDEDRLQCRLQSPQESEKTLLAIARAIDGPCHFDPRSDRDEHYLSFVTDKNILHYARVLTKPELVLTLKTAEALYGREYALQMQEGKLRRQLSLPSVR